MALRCLLQVLHANQLQVMFKWSASNFLKTKFHAVVVRMLSAKASNYTIVRQTATRQVIGEVGVLLCSRLESYNLYTHCTQRLRRLCMLKCTISLLSLLLIAKTSRGEW